jgi:D-tyrosyl-tRNA(Tyr) deacylase
VRAVVQRVSEASVDVEGRVVSAIGPGLLVLLGVGRGDGALDVDYLVDKVLNLRIFPDEEGHMNRSVLDVRGAVLAVSQFTLYGDVRRGRRPGFSEAAAPEVAQELYAAFVEGLKGSALEVGEGIFRAHMGVRLTNDGPVTILLDSRKEF